jgi:tetratricopeptide (TPR) repeat protein
MRWRAASPSWLHPCTRLGQYEQAEQHWQNALTIFQELGNRRLGMDTLSNLGVIADARGDYETAFQRYHSALEIAAKLDIVMERSYS